MSRAPGPTSAGGCHRPTRARVPRKILEHLIHIGPRETAKRTDRRELNLIATPDREHEPVTGQTIRRIGRTTNTADA